MIDDIFDNLSETELTEERAPWFGEGVFLATISEMQRKRTFKKDDALIVEFEIEDEEGNPIGRRSWYQSLLKINSEKKVKAFLYAACGVNPTTPEGIKQGKDKLDHRLSSIGKAAVSDKQMLRGRKLLVKGENRTVTDQKTGEKKEYLNLVFMPR